ncbi:MAG: ParB N-terminal domain-containing protein [Candidatus Magnetomorum sp.]|nr:ParB N-terminal domain-containing protein [Candidatus Magnetomorum sp.]
MNYPEKLFKINLNQVSLALERLHLPSSKRIEKMEKSLKDQGQISPIALHQSNKEYMLIDGFKRYRAAKNLGWKSLSAVGIQTNEYNAKAMVYLMNQSGSFSMIQEAVLIKELVDQDGLTQKEAGILFGRHKSWISRRLDMIRHLHPEVIENFLLELIPPGVGPTLARVAPCNQGDIVAAIQKDQLIAGEINLLVDLYCKTSDPGMKKSILQTPRQSISILKQTRKKFSWFKKIQIMRSNMEKFEQQIFNNRQKISENGFEILSCKVSDIKAKLIEILPIMQKEGIWED